MERLSLKPTADMSAFKAANPDAIFEDFIRWHSPRDWENDDNEENRMSESSSWPPRGKLSDRMSDAGNSWRKIWNEAPAVPASEQKPLWDPNREGEKVLLLLATYNCFNIIFLQSCLTLCYRDLGSSLSGDSKTVSTARRSGLCCLQSSG